MISIELLRVIPNISVVYVSAVVHVKENFNPTVCSTVEEENIDRGYSLYVSDAVWDDVITIRMLDVYQNEERVQFEQEVIEFTWNGE